MNHIWLPGLVIAALGLVIMWALWPLRPRSGPCRRCGDPYDAHQHYAEPGDLRCSLCGCRKFRRGRVQPGPADHPAQGDTTS